MVDIKLIVLITNIVYSSCVNYCEICRNHTLCLFVEAGPNISCKSYNNTVLLTRVEINEIVNRINERRNYIAMGLNGILPQAANMRKIFWSLELALFAQRWVDQCDQTLQPDNKDECRDLAHSKVGQNIATILGPTLGLHIKSFVEMWYIQILQYKGTVTYYNQSRQYNTDYFTQLIWAETDSVGCGKARFYVKSKNTTAERLVCNFAPKGNVHGKPIYTIGYPSTQCPSDMIHDSKYTALCVKRYNITASKFATQPSQVSSLLRILNLSNTSAKQEIDPIRNNLKQINNTSYKSKGNRNQKLRHVYFSHSHGDMKRVSPLRNQNFWNPSMNVSYIDHNHQERGHSRVYHGYESHIQNHDVQEGKVDNILRKYDFSTEPLNSYSTGDLRKYVNQIYQCTRRMKPPRNNYDAHQCNTPTCTRAKIDDNCHPSPSICHSNTFREDMMYSPPNCNSFNELCPCNKRTICHTTTTECICDTNCRCLNIGVTPRCPELLKRNNVNHDETRKSQEYKRYDLLAPLIVRSGNEKLTNSNSSPKPQKNYNKIMIKIDSKTDYDQYHQQVKGSNAHPQSNDGDSEYLYETFDSSGRNKRDLEESATFKPFWEIDQYHYKRPSELKSIRYTTLGYKTRRNSKRTTLTPKPKVVTESITINNTPLTRGIKNYISEKYLSFDELMRLRKFTAQEIYQNARRRASDDNILRDGNTSSSFTTEITTNTPFMRKKHCTRKLTCTWTALTISGGDMIAGGGFDRGSRTPPGYVDGCTRTSTCTREFMNRNKMSTIPDNFSSEVTPEDEDYCERRALNVQRRNLENKIVTGLTIDYQYTYHIEATASTTEINYNADFTSQLETGMFVPQYGCLCNHNNARKKRDGYLSNEHENKYSIRKTNSYATTKNSISPFQYRSDTMKCICNGAAVIIKCHVLIILILLI